MTGKSQRLSRNHHYVPQYWIRGFAITGTGEVWTRSKGSSVQRKSINNVMAMDWYNITFNENFIASDKLETALSVPENNAKNAFQQICNNPKNISPASYGILLSTIALVACRHPDIRARHQQYVDKIGRGIITIRTAENYDTAQVSFREETGFELTYEQYEAISDIQDNELLDSLMLAKKLDDYHPALPAHILSLEAVPGVAAQLMTYDCEIVTSSCDCFVLSNRPVPTEPQSLSRDFSVPLTSKVAIRLSQKRGAENNWPPLPHHTATPKDIEDINEEQCARADIIVGNDKGLIDGLAIL